MSELIYGLSTVSFIGAGSVTGLLAFLYTRAYFKQKKSTPVFSMAVFFSAGALMYAICTVLYVFRVFNTPFESAMIIGNSFVALTGLNLTKVTFGD